jgi:hypothetical protein
MIFIFYLITFVILLESVSLSIDSYLIPTIIISSIFQTIHPNKINYRNYLFHQIAFQCIKNSEYNKDIYLKIKIFFNLVFLYSPIIRSICP